MICFVCENELNDSYFKNVSVFAITVYKFYPIDEMSKIEDYVIFLCFHFQIVVL